MIEREEMVVRRRPTQLERQLRSGGPRGEGESPKLGGRCAVDEADAAQGGRHGTEKGLSNHCLPGGTCWVIYGVAAAFSTVASDSLNAARKRAMTFRFRRIAARR